ncbi:type 2 isopentenyl-diphosphate Delta-isomerase [Myxococcus llanfairpwllgwyngyllgogerychwyrndrobwllllantysiliogogogochensis]|uniref:Isopentenyl-diphosphate delta-isomerase n=1 Tax=Myxococcus llanfairpwllgwyngyllgogerychwyrndrobwllllantysiliogogogochensis TaxID=2590453 RepID=A0A540WYQ2_9BACT|nr:type 2 isopentenyl-diphosphate Delta-isomerase [Myxococcus llanfairpwllgwyngyllgogerychwyrndrobwllllantysiliogogogochensis]TQF14080.1 type 2 isopentenyl-diphosphate Delta-isomerase [Myxococcus llanfairpwllgwyngyllgogerychwyrndrobwllllantysiliogogogochensis]
MVEDITARRKDAHLDLCATGDVEPGGNSTLLEHVHLVHCAMPEMAVEDVDLSTPFLGKQLRHPLLVTGMTGGTERAGAVNRDLALLAERHGLAFGVGSQRAMSEDVSRAASFQVRQVAPTVALLGNIGLYQAVRLGVDGVRRLMEDIGADGIALHLNAGQELTQPEGDRDFRGGYDVVGALVKAFGDRLLVKETGCGIGPDVARRLVALGVRNLDVSGLGGTSWVRVEQLRATGVQAQVGAEFSAWGIPTAAAVATVRAAVGPEVRLVGSGGVRTGLEVAKVLALGADLGGMALPLFRAQQAGGVEAAEQALAVILSGLRQALVLTGSRSCAELRQRPRVVTGVLKDWIAAL